MTESVVGLVQIPPVDLHPTLDVVGQPHLALGEVGYRLRKVGTAGDLVRTLAAYPTQADADLVRAHESDRFRGHEITVGAGLLVVCQLYGRQLVMSQLG